MPRTQAEIHDRFTTIRKSGDDIFGFRQEALLDAMTYETAASTGLLKEGVDASDWTEPNVAHTARQYLLFAIGKAITHRGISASRSVEKLSEWLWCLGEDELAARFDAADYPQYGAPKLAMLAQAWGVEHDHIDDPGWQRMVKGLPCKPICDAGCGSRPMAHPPTNYLADDIRRIARLHPAEQTAALDDLADRVERYAVETTVTGELDVMATGLDPEQAIRAAAVYATGWPHGSHRTAEFWESLAEVEAYIRDGSRP